MVRGIVFHKHNVLLYFQLGSNLSGFFLINAGAQSESVWGHLQQRQVETIVSIERVGQILLIKLDDDHRFR